MKASSTQFEFFVDLVTQAQDVSALDILLFPAPGILLPLNATYRLRLEQQAKLKATSGKVASVLIEQAKREKFNFALFGCKFDPHTVPGADIKIVAFACQLTLAPTNALWHNTNEWTPVDNDNVRETFRLRRGYEKRTAYNDITAAPTVAQFKLNIESTLTADELEGELSAALRASFVDSLIRDDILLQAGGAWPEEDSDDPRADYDRTFYVPAILDRAYHFDKAPSLLVPRFERLMRFMAGPYSACAGLQAALGAAVKLYAVPSQCHQIGFLDIPLDVVGDADAQARAAAFLVPRDSTTAALTFDNNEVGEYRPGGRQLMTRRRDLELEAKFPDPYPAQWEKGGIPRSPLFPVIAPRFSALLAIDDLDMIIQPRDAGAWAEECARIEKNYAAQPAELPLVQRVWNAHVDVWKHYPGWRSTEEIELLRSLFFPPIDPAEAMIILPPAEPGVRFDVNPDGTPRTPAETQVAMMRDIRRRLKMMAPRIEGVITEAINAPDRKDS